ncbi:MAG: glucan biosynthesis protein D [Xanthomonadaceae bacterium]|jgi:glucans biosynthesis protein|nr:glucan biosynthesis protein D [Xanthomonadaceae bacterium]
MSRRQFLKNAAAALASLSLPLPALLLSDTTAARGLRRLGQPRPFDYAWLKGRARTLAMAPYQGSGSRLPAAVAGLSWDQYQAIRYRDGYALWADDDGGRFQVRFFHLGLYFKSPVHIYELADGQAQELAYDPEAFDYGNSGLKGAGLPSDLGFAGFRLTPNDSDRDFAAFLGASYFRAVGRDGQFGLSARGLAIDCGMDRPEEFPNFVAFWLERPAAGSETVVVYALLDSPSIAGAYRFVITPGEPLVMDVDCALYPRKSIERLGIAPCTSMYQYGENDRRMAWDWRPEIHDSDGLSMHTGSDEWIWRPLSNPERLRFNMFLDENPRGFGLLQRDRNFDHYQDDGVYYEKRPSLWVEPKHGWGRGSVQLVEIPTVDETFDNIVAFWNPEEKPQAGQELLFGYRLFWGAQPPAQPPLAKCVATRTGLGGAIGKKREYFSWRFAVDFAGGALASLGDGVKVEPVLSLSRGSAEIVSAWALREIQGYRAMFDVVPPDDSTDQIDIRLFLRSGERTLTETWLYQWNPPPPSQRILY